MLKILLFPILVLLFNGVVVAEPEKWEPIRPSVFLILKDPAPSTTRPDINSLVQVIHASARYLWKSSEPAIPEFVENIVLIEGDTEWLVAFFEKGNGRVAVTINGVVHIDHIVHLNPGLIRVSKATLHAENCTSLVAVPWPVTVPVRLSVRYSDPTPAERNEAAELAGK